MLRPMRGVRNSLRKLLSGLREGARVNRKSLWITREVDTYLQREKEGRTERASSCSAALRKSWSGPESRLPISGAPWRAEIAWRHVPTAPRPRWENMLSSDLKGQQLAAVG